jgi:hypothetical protein
MFCGELLQRRTTMKYTWIRHLKVDEGPEGVYLVRLEYLQPFDRNFNPIPGVAALASDLVNYAQAIIDSDENLTAVEATSVWRTVRIERGGESL